MAKPKQKIQKTKLEKPVFKKPSSKKYLYFAVAAIAIFIIGSQVLFEDGNGLNYDHIVANLSNLTQEVNVSGRVKSSESVDLSFENSGKITNVYVEIGQKVKAGAVLARLNSSELYAYLAQANADYASAEAELMRYDAILDQEEAILAGLKTGTRPEEIQIAQTSLTNAKTDLADEELNIAAVQSEADINLENVYQGVIDILNDVYTKSDFAINQQLENLFNENQFPANNLSFNVQDNSLETNARWNKDEADRNIASFSNTISGLSELSSYDNYDSALNEATKTLTSINSLLSSLSAAVEDSASLSESIKDTHRTNINSARTNIDTALSSVNSKKQSITSQKATNNTSITVATAALSDAEKAVLAAQDELLLKQAGTTPEQIAAQEAKVKQAEANIGTQKARINSAGANVQLYQARIAKNTLRSPINGIITFQDAKVGEIASALTPIISVMSEARFQIEANIPEVDIANVTTGDIAVLTLDAYRRGTEFAATVIKIDPAEIVIEGVSTYKVTLEFEQEDVRIKSGMTANIDINTDSREQVFSVPQRAIIYENSNKFLQVIDNDIIERVKVETGLVGQDGLVEIISGLEEGDVVVTYLKE